MKCQRKNELDYLVMQKQLEDFGLGEKEAKVYIASLALGRATADQLAKQAGIKRPTAYVQIESLTKMGLMSTFEEGKKTYFVPESPEGLQRLLARKKEEVISREKELTNLLPELLRNFDGAGDKPVVRFFEGKNGVISLRDEVLKTSAKEIYVISSADALENAFSLEERVNYSEKRAKAGISIRMIYTRMAGKFKDPAPSNTERAYISSEQLTMKTDLVIYGDTVGIITLEGHLVGVSIKNPEISKSLKSIFEVLWLSAEKH